MKAIYSIFILILFHCFLFSQTQSSTAVDSIIKSIPSDSVKSTPVDSLVSAKAAIKTDSSTNHSIKLNKKSYNHKNQIFLATGMMAFIAVILATVQNWNPD